MKLETFKCDACGKIKGEANKWYRMIIIARALVLESFGVADGAIDQSTVEPDRVLDLCGEGCVQKKLQEFMSAAHPESEAAK